MMNLTNEHRKRIEEIRSLVEDDQRGFFIGRMDVSFLLDLLDEATRPVVVQREMSVEDRATALEFLAEADRQMYEDDPGDAIDRAVEANFPDDLSDSEILLELGIEYCDESGNFDIGLVDQLDLSERFMLWAKYRKPAVREHLLQQKQAEGAT